ncbi:HNH endonuclease family protein [Streptomyces viridodiastaticus]|nr:HNH endonuclease family protein [Streptomyces viridodiastaticus]MCX4618002.1 HNH endonuclease family protein [Streptomyces viridodiastaticus]MCX4625026.1 HNH endonuclease family protein [Streptomyces viridodiastaticus]
MIRSMVRSLAALSVLLVPLAGPGSARAAETLPLAEAVASLPSAVESRDGYDRSAFRHWTRGDDLTDGCNTRNEVLLAEAIEPPEVGEGCRLTGGRWWSYYDSQWVTSASDLDIDHMVPLAEAWDSGAFAWSSARREAYANDQGSEVSLVAVSAWSNRSKADQDPAEWLPPTGDVHCRYVVEWVGTKLRWGLSADTRELAALNEEAAGCTGWSVTYEPAA